MNFFTLTLTFIDIPPLICIVFLPSNLHLHSNYISFVNVFDSSIPVIMSKTLRFKSSDLFGIHILLDKSFRVLQLQKHLSNFTESNFILISFCIH